MREARAGVIALLSLLLALPAVLAQTPQSGAAWDEVGGGAARTGAAFLPATTLDVLEARDLFGDDMEIDLRYTKGLVSTPHGLRAMAKRGTECVLLAIERDAVRETVLDGCVPGTLAAYDRANDRLLICSIGAPDADILQSRHAATGQLIWGTGPADLDAQTAPQTLWTCRGLAMSPDGDLFAAFLSAVDERDATDAVAERFPPPAPAAYVARLDLATGSNIADRTLMVSDFYGSAVAEVGLSPGFVPFGLSLTESGLVVSGRVSCACGKADPISRVGEVIDENQDWSARNMQGAVAWLRPDDLTLVGTALAEDQVDGPDTKVGTRWFGQWWAATNGPLAGFALGDHVYVVNPAEDAAVHVAPFEGIETGEGFYGVAPSVWWSNRLLVPIAKSVTAIDAQTETLGAMWSQTFGDSWIVSGLLVLPPSDVLVLAAENANSTGAEIDVPARLHRLDLATGHELQRIDLPGTIRMTGGTGRAGFQPMDDGTLLVYSLDGRLFTLGTADPALRPTIAISNSYPAPSEGVSVSIDSPDPSVTYTIAWGDGTVETNGTSWTHRYGDAEPHTARVTAQFADGRTATTERVIRVGEAPPAELNALQVAFSDKWQNVTFGVLGLLLTLAFSLFAIYARRRRHSRLHDELVALERIREQGRSDAHGAIRALGHFRERLIAEVAAHQIDDAQFNSLDARANVVFGALRTRLLGPLAGRLSADFRHAVDVVLHDGRVDPTELATLARALDAERQLTAEERADLARLFERMAGA